MVIDVIVMFSRSKGFQKVGTWMQVAIRVILHEDSSRSSEGGVGHDKEGFGMVWEGEYQLLQEGILDLGKH